MPRASDTRQLQAATAEIWALVCDPHHLPRWWPRVERVEGVAGSSFTEVLRSERGRLVRADFDVILRDDAQMRLVWAQQVDGTPFARVLAASQTEVRVQPRMGMNAAAATEVTITLTQTLRPWFLGTPAAPPGSRLGGGMLSPLFARLGGPMVSKAAARTVKEALDGLERIAI